MRSFLKRLVLNLLVSAGLAGSVRADEAGVLLWMVDNPEIYRNGEKIASLSGFTSADGYQATAARVVATAEDGTSVYLNLCYANDEGEFVESGLTEARLVDGYKAGPIVTSLGSLTVESYTYAIELGTFVDGSWHTLAVSDPHAFDNIKDFTSTAGFGLPGDIWMPTAYNVPEPTGGLLVLMGLAMLALRRKEVRT